MTQRPTGDEVEALATGRTPIFRWLLGSHCVPVLVVSVAVVVILVGLVHVTSLLRTLAEQELESLHDEGGLHRAAWTLDVSMRHGEGDCRSGQAPDPPRERVSFSEARLRTMLGQVQADVAAPMRQLSLDYLELAEEMQSRRGCEGLLAPDLLRRRALLDEQLTNVWVSRLQELHREVSRKDRDAREFGNAAAIGGILIAGLSLVVAVVVAARAAGVLTRALANLTETAQRVGRGDFRTPVSIGNPPSELADFGDELERMRLQLEQLETLKQEILASISHELRTPLSKIRESLALLQDGVVGEVDPRQRKVVQIARRACESEIRMVTTLLDLSRLRAGSPVRRHPGVSLDHLVARAIDDERAVADERGVAIKLEAAGDSPTGNFDSVMIERAIANLIRNAIAVSNRGQTVTVRRTFVHDRPGARTWACVRVEDHGPGVPEEIRESMFNAFVTRAVPNSAKSVGIGIGLSLAREIASAHAGELDCPTQPTGAVFRLWLPLDDQPSPSTTS
ncbi:sensor histidine kinase [Enhygromyxa salina]|uniref:sensor histidine kinase n=1 Tax=Enhygromyxa salina TaxID=215803 RepID=UPI0011B1F327|nr:HAMP domain-containing sensor histidine kinase [Enhygromyxa salina]